MHSGISLRSALRDLSQAADVEAWSACAAEIDRLRGLDAWRADDESDVYDTLAIERDIRAIRRAQATGSDAHLASLLHDSVARHNPDISHPSLYTTAWSGTKHLVTRWLDTVTSAIDQLAGLQGDESRRARRVQTMRREKTALGGTALMLSGGATLGFIHLGVVKALFEHGLLPTVVSGASMGAMIAAGIETRNDAELRALFADPSHIERRGLATLAARDLPRRHAILDPDVLLETIRTNLGHDFTFAQARAHTGRSLVLSVAPTRRGQRPRVLDPLTSPDVWIAEAALASSALPGVFPPVSLMRREPDGSRQPYLPEERWIDGSVGLDLPKRWLTRLYQIDRFIVSQTNPHVLPFLSDPHHQGAVKHALGLGGKALLRQTSFGLAAAAAATADTPIRPYTAFAHAMTAQDYTGDISIHPRFRPQWLGRLFSNPTREELAAFILEGERATWPHLVRIEATTRIERALDRAITRLSLPPTSEPAP